MKKLTQKPYSEPKSIINKTSACLIGTVACAAALPLAVSNAKADMASRSDALVNLELSDHYLTPRGMDVQDHGLVFQPLVLGFFNLYKSDTAFIRDVTLDAGVWNCFGTGALPATGPQLNPPTGPFLTSTHWYEIDPIAGFSIDLPSKFTLSETFSCFDMQILNIPFSEHLETKLAWDDSDYLGKFALNPYFSYWQDIVASAVATSGPIATSDRYYFDAGVSPGYTFKDCGLKLEAPCRVLLPGQGFYGTEYKDTTVGLFELGFKASIPLKFMPDGYGHWSFHAGFKYQNFNDPNLVATQHKSDAQMFYCGLSTFF